MWEPQGDYAAVSGQEDCGMRIDSCARLFSCQEDWRAWRCMEMAAAWRALAVQVLQSYD